MKCLILFLLLTQLCVAQESSIHGFIKDKKTEEPIIFAHIFIANTAKGTTSDTHGQFALENIPTGEFTLVCSMVGYDSYIKNIKLVPGTQIELIIEMNISTYVLDNIELVDREDKRWQKEFKEFKRELLGNMPNAAYCEIINPWVVDFEEYRRNKIIKAHVNQPIVIHNNALGYEITFLLVRFEKEQGRLFYVGYPSFDSMNGNDSIQLEDFVKNREDTYKGSLKHFFYALVHNKFEEEGFKVFRIANGYENRKLQFLKESSHTAHFNPLKVTEVVSDSNPWGIYTVYTNEILEVIYTKKEWKDSPYLDAPYQVSRIQINDELEVSKTGYVFNPYAYVVSGYLSEERLANMLPFEYRLEKTNQTDPQ